MPETEPIQQQNDPETDPNDDPNDPNNEPALILGPPFAIAGGDCGLSTEGPGCYCVVDCNCGQLFKINLLDGEFKKCPQCEQSYTHGLVVCATDDDETTDDMIKHIMVENGYDVLDYEENAPPDFPKPPPQNYVDPPQTIDAPEAKTEPDDPTGQQ